MEWKICLTIYQKSSNDGNFLRICSHHSRLLLGNRHYRCKNQHRTDVHVHHNSAIPPLRRIYPGYLRSIPCLYAVSGPVQPAFFRLCSLSYLWHAGCPAPLYGIVLFCLWLCNNALGRGCSSTFKSGSRHRRFALTNSPGMAAGPFIGIQTVLNIKDKHGKYR